jgi:antitoxin CptB
MREVDLLLGRYADVHVGSLDEAGLAGFEALLDVPDRELLGWIMGQTAIPAESDSAMLRQVIAFHGGN